MTNLDRFGEDIAGISKTAQSRENYSVEFTVTSSCNFRCSYCCEGESCTVDSTFEDFDNAFKMIDGFLVDDWFLSRFGGLNIGFWGGEPTLRPDVVKKIVDRYKNDHMVTFFIYTNGYKCDTLIDLFKDIKDKVNIQVSYDGGIINRKNRVLAGGQETSDKVRETIYRLSAEGFNYHLKSTLTYNDMQYLGDAWDDIKSLHDELGKHIRYSVTVDYTKEYNMDMAVVRKNFVDIAKREKKFFRENGYHLFSWFEGQKKKCTFMKYGMCIDTNGDLLYCHGCSYSCNRDDLVFGHITDGDIIDKVIKNYGYFNAPEIPACGDCISDTCMTCNVQKHINSKKDGFFDRWYDLTCQTEQCDMFREFSKVRKALEDVLRRD